MTEVDIVMPCYNCAPWVDAMIESILAQEGPSWRLIARDDGSSDGTGERLAAWRERLGERMILLDNATRTNLGLCGAYTALLEATTASRILTADSDDVWLPGHVARAVDALERAEAETGVGVPIAIGTDAKVIDEHGEPIAASYWKWLRLRSSRVRRLVDVAMESPALGSTMAVNRALLEVALPIPPAAHAQDWWLALVAVAFGRFDPLAARSILYRRHASNSTARPFGDSTSMALLRAIRAPASARARARRLLGEIAPQAQAFADRYAARLPAADLEALRSLARLPERSSVARRIALIRYGCTFSSPLKTMGLWVFC